MVHRVVAGVIGFVYASVGFILSVLALLLGLLIPAKFNASPLEGSKPPIRSDVSEKHRSRPLYTSSKGSSNTSISSSSVPSTPNDSHSSVTFVSLSNTSLPPSPTPFQRVEHANDPSYPKLNRQPTITFIEDSLKAPSASATRLSIPLPSERICVPSDDSQSGLKIPRLRPPWADKRQKINRCVSSPHLTTANPPLPLPVARVEELKLPDLSLKKLKTFRKALSHPPTPRSASCPILAMPEKKQRTPAPRTQPYEAPYFFPPPIPTDSNAPYQRKPVRSRTLPPTSRRQPASSEGKTLTIGGTLAPPIDHHVAPRR